MFIFDSVDITNKFNSSTMLWNYSGNGTRQNTFSLTIRCRGTRIKVTENDLTSSDTLSIVELPKEYRASQYFTSQLLTSYTLRKKTLLFCHILQVSGKMFEPDQFDNCLRIEFIREIVFILKNFITFFNYTQIISWNQTDYSSSSLSVK